MPIDSKSSHPLKLLGATSVYAGLIAESEKRGLGSSIE